MKHSEMVREFHKAFSAPIGIDPTPEQRLTRIKLLAEEFIEYLEAEGVRQSVLSAIDDAISIIAFTREPNKVGIADALGDMKYIIEGTAVAYGIPLDECFEEIHRSNMSKLPPDGVPLKRADGKILKPPTYTRPDLGKIISR